MTQMPRLTSPSHVDAVALFAQRRAAIDMIATVRAKTIRAALFATYLFRPHPTQPEDQATRDGWRTILKEQYEDMAQICQLLRGEDVNSTVPGAVNAWIGMHAARHPNAVKEFEKTRDLTRDLFEAAEAEDAAALERALEAHKTYGRSGFFEVVTEFCDGLWELLDEKRHYEVTQATATATAISKTLKRLEHIGKHVRLVSLNASVEAARVGDAGRGLGVIAVEFKTLAEEIQQLATHARTDISAMTEQAAGTADEVEKTP